ncbi:MAG TPA: Uma2 family endonuclease [Thermoanaerobaculia bacterium]|nr:Uma2 family endonuclease [Thermoanaerobaculia bacterium]
MSTPESAFLTPTEYLEIERRSEIKHEYINGRMYALPGASRQHIKIALSVAASLRSQLEDRNCDVYMADMRVNVHPSGRYVYPDVVAVCGEQRFEDFEVDTLLNPTVIVEVLSDTTERHDRGEKFDLYRTIASLREYVLVAQNTMRVEHYVLQEGQWVFSALKGAEEHLVLASIGCEISLADVYKNVEFPPPKERPRLA